MRKLILPILLTLGAMLTNLVAGVVPAFAMTTVRGVDYYSVEEILAGVASEAATDNLFRRDFVITAFYMEPGKEWIEVLFQDHRHDPALPLDELFIAWMDDETAATQARFDSDIDQWHPVYVNAIKSGATPDGVHVGVEIYPEAGNSPLQANVVHRFDLSGMDLANNESRQLYYYFAQELYMNAQTFEYGGACMNDPNYTVTTECHAMVGDNGGINYDLVETAFVEPTYPMTSATGEVLTGNYWGAYEILSGEASALATEQFSSDRFVITNIDPNQNQITILYRDYSPVFYGNFPMREMYVAWLTDEELSQVSSGYPKYAKIIRHDPGYEAITLDMAPDLHPIVIENEIINGQNWFSSNLEQTRLSDTDLFDNFNHQIYYAVYSAFGEEFLNSINYSSCINSDLYDASDPTITCELAYHEDGSSKPVYLPARDRKLLRATDPTEDPVDPVEDPIDLATTTESSNKPTTAGNDHVAVKAPETGSAGSETACNGTEFPWWLVVSLVSADLLFLWWVAPNRKRVK